MKRLSGIILAIILLVVLVVPVMAYSLYAAIQVQNSAATAYNDINITALKNMKYLASSNVILSSGLDVSVVEGGSTLASMVADDRLNFNTDVGANGTTNVQFRAGNTPAASMSMVTGYGGYITTNDDADLELTSVYQVEVNDTYFDVSTRNTGPVMTKRVTAVATGDESFRIQTDGNGSLVAQNYGTVTAQESNAGPLTTNRVTGGTTWRAQTFTASATYRVASVEVQTAVGAGNPGAWTISLRATAAGVPTGVDLALFTETQANISGAAAYRKFHVPPIELTNGTVYAIVFRAPAGNVATDYYSVAVDATPIYGGGQEYSSTDSGVSWSAVAADFLFRINLTPDTVEASGLTSGVKTVKVTQDGTGAGKSMKLYIGGALVDTTTPSTSAVPNNAANWTWMPIQTGWTQMPYIGAVLISVNSLPVLQYQPNDMVHGVAYTTGTATFTTGSAIVTGAGGAAWTSAMVGTSIKHNANNVWYRVVSVDSSTQVTLNLNYVEAGGAGAAYTMAPNIPDRATANGAHPVSEMGIITWGTNPGTFTVTWGSLVSTGQPVGSTAQDSPTQDVLGPVTLPSMTGSGVAASFPLQPIVGQVTDVTTFSTSQVWLWIGFWLLMAVVVVVLVAFQSMFMASAAMTAMFIVLYKIGVVPWWTILVTILICISLLVAERRQSF